MKQQGKYSERHIVKVINEEDEHGNFGKTGTIVGIVETQPGSIHNLNYVVKFDDSDDEFTYIESELELVKSEEKEQPVKLIEEVVVVEEKPKQKLYEKKIEQIGVDIEKQDADNTPLTKLSSKFVNHVTINRTEAISLAVDLIKRSRELDGESTETKDIVEELKEWGTYLLDTER